MSSEVLWGRANVWGGLEVIVKFLDLSFLGNEKALSLIHISEPTRPHD